MPLRFDTISFLSDYGTTDEFVGVVKSVIRSIAPEVTVVDITHEVPPYDVRAGSLTLVRSAQYLCPGVVLAIVDPGVGTSRRAVAVEVGDGESYLIGPDNGVLAPAVGLVGGTTRAVELDNPGYQLPAPGATFAGRDVFAPAAAHLCAGVPLEELGTPIDPATMVPGVVPLPRDENGTVVGQVLWVDRYGNCQLNVDPEQVEAWGDRVQVRWRTAGTAGSDAPRVRTARRTTAFDDLGRGEVGLVVDSYGLLAVTLARGSAADQLDLAANDEVVLVPLGDGPDEPDTITETGDQATGVTVPVTLGGKPR
jgi:S-adenosyl-L-methionine hydrolase (adenosine-forming)